MPLLPIPIPIPALELDPLSPRDDEEVPDDGTMGERICSYLDTSHAPRSLAYDTPSIARPMLGNIDHSAFVSRVTRSALSLPLSMPLDYDSMSISREDASAPAFTRAQTSRTSSSEAATESDSTNPSLDTFLVHYDLGSPSLHRLDTAPTLAKDSVHDTAYVVAVKAPSHVARAAIAPPLLSPSLSPAADSFVSWRHLKVAPPTAVR